MPSFMSKVVAFSQRRQRTNPYWRAGFWPDAERDIFLVTYPRSGTTWISCIAAELLFQISPKSLTEIGSLVPDVHALPKKSAVPAARQYLVKSHFPFSSTHIPPFGSYHRVIYVIRDPRDVLLSFHRYSKFLSNYTGNLKEFAMDWAAGRVWPGSWHEHVNSWLAPRFQAAPFELTVFRYEDFVADPIAQTGRLAKVLGVDAELARIAEIVADTRPQSMRERVIKGNSGIGPEVNFIGPAKAGNWKLLHSNEDRDAISIIEEFAGEVMRREGYACTAEATARSSTEEQGLAPVAFKPTNRKHCAAGLGNVLATAYESNIIAQNLTLMLPE